MAAITLIGMGRLGLPMVGRFVAAGHDVNVIDVRDELASVVEGIGARWGGGEFAALPPDGVLITVLPGNAELREVMLGRAGRRAALSVLGAGDLWVDMTSAGPETATELAAAAQDRGVRYVDAAIGGGPGEARHGTLSLYVGGNDSDILRARPLLDVVAEPTRIHHMGGHGTGYLTKLLINQLWFGQAVAIGEAMLLGARCGVAAQHLAAVVAQSPAASAFVDRYLPTLLAGDYLPAFGLGRIVEELDSLRRAAATLQVPWTVGTSVTDVHTQALDSLGDIDGELLAVAHLERQAGTTLQLGGPHDDDQDSVDG